MTQVVSEQFGWDPSAPGAWVPLVVWAVLACFGTWRALRRSRGWSRGLGIAACWVVPFLGAVLVLALLRHPAQGPTSVRE